MIGTAATAASILGKSISGSNGGVIGGAKDLAGGILDDIGGFLGIGGNNRDKKRDKRDKAKNYLVSQGVKPSSVDSGNWHSDNWLKYVNMANRVMRLGSANRRKAIEHINKTGSLTGFSSATIPEELDNEKVNGNSSPAISGGVGKIATLGLLGWGVKTFLLD